MIDCVHIGMISSDPSVMVLSYSPLSPIPTFSFGHATLLHRFFVFWAFFFLGDVQPSLLRVGPYCCVTGSFPSLSFLKTNTKATHHKCVTIVPLPPSRRTLKQQDSSTLLARRSSLRYSLVIQHNHKYNLFLLRSQKKKESTWSMITLSKLRSVWNAAELSLDSDVGGVK